MVNVVTILQRAGRNRLRLHADVVRYLRWFTFLGRDEIDDLARATEETPHLRLAQKRLAAEMTTLIHGAAHTAASMAASMPLHERALCKRRRPKHRPQQKMQRQRWTM